MASLEVVLFFKFLKTAPPPLPSLGLNYRPPCFTQTTTSQHCSEASERQRKDCFGQSATGRPLRQKPKLIGCECGHCVENRRRRKAKESTKTASGRLGTPRLALAARNAASLPSTRQAFFSWGLRHGVALGSFCDAGYGANPQNRLIKITRLKSEGWTQVQIEGEGGEGRRTNEPSEKIWCPGQSNAQEA